MKRHHGQLRFLAGRQAFTLVELLIVCIVIAILVALTLFAINKARNASKVTKTRATIQKLDVAMRQIFVSYEERFVHIKRMVAKKYPTLSNRDRQKIAAHFIRDLMRMEMPQNWEEVKTNPLEIQPGRYAIEESPLLKYYRKAYEKAKDTNGALSDPSAFRAALLFLIIQNLNPEALEAFHGSEVADTNGDGLMEFVDAWGKPIQFLRWAPAFHGSDLQPDVFEWLENPKYDAAQDNTSWWTQCYPNDPRLLAAIEEAKEIQTDMLDEREDTIEWKKVGWYLYPLIYSAGLDGKYGIEEGENEPPAIGNEGILDPFRYPFGMPVDSSHFDNIHNHQWYRSF